MKLFDKLKKLLGLTAIQEGWNRQEQYSTPDILSVWEDDYLMVELLPVENLDFIREETRRVEDHAREHFDGNGYTAITALEEPRIPLVDRQILLEEALHLMSETGMKRLEQMYFEGVALESKRMPICFGCGEYGLLFEHKEGILTHIWVAGHRFTTDKAEFEEALRTISAKYRLLMVNWYLCRFYNLNNDSEMQQFLNWE